MLAGPEVRMTLNYIIDSSKEKYRDLPAIGMAMEEPISYGELHDRICALAAQFQIDGIAKGDRVAIFAENSQHWGIAYLAIVRIGGVGVPILPDLPEADVHHILTEMKVKMLFTTKRQLEKIYEMSGELPATILTLDDYQSVEGLLQVDRFSDYLEKALGEYRKEKEPGEGLLLKKLQLEKAVT